MDIKIPFLAEGVESGTVVSILVKPGDRVKKDQTVLELETNKATAPIPSPADGVVEKILVKEGDTVNIGQSVIALSGGAASSVPAAKREMPKPAASAPGPISKAVIQTPVQSSVSGLFPPPASPSVRKLARELGIDLGRIKGSERGGRITLEDVRAYIQQLQAGVISAGPVPQTPAKTAVSIDFSKWGPVQKKAMSPLRKKIGEKMQESWTHIPHVTQFDEADITDLMGIRKKQVAAYEKKGARLTLTGILLKVLVPLLKKYPMFNSSLDEGTNEIVYKEYYHLGIAVDTEQGLIVPVLKNADQKDMVQISTELEALAEKTRQRKISLDELQGGTFTISNLGGIGGTFFTPVVNRPEAAILGVGRGVLRPVVRNHSIEPRLMLPLGLSYDHRLIDGADGARFIKELVAALERFDESMLKIDAVLKSVSNEQKTLVTSKKGKK